jgi:hypothetical protein
MKVGNGLTGGLTRLCGNQIESQEVEYESIVNWHESRDCHCSAHDCIVSFDNGPCEAVTR